MSNGTLFSEATKVERLDSHTYRVHLHKNFCIGAVPNGGYTSSCMLAAASMHLSSRGQSHTLTAHFEYPNRTAAGPAIVVVEDVKLGRQISTLHLTLWQGALLPQAPWVTPSSRRAVLAYTTHTDLGSFEGITLPVGWAETPAASPPPLPDFAALTKRSDAAWAETKPPSSAKNVHSLRSWRMYTPRAGPLTPGVLDMWVRLASGERIAQGALAFVVDSFPFDMHASLVTPEMRALLAAPPPRGGGGGRSSEEAREDDEEERPRQSVWLPTVVLNLEVKMALPDEGVEWLAVRVTSKQIKDGKFDLEVLVRDVDGEMVAQSHQVALIVDMERNMGKAKSLL